MKKLLVIAVVGAAITGAVFAGPSTPNIRTQEDIEAYVSELFERYDTDGGGSISREEVSDYYAQTLAD